MAHKGQSHYKQDKSVISYVIGRRVECSFSRSKDTRCLPSSEVDSLKGFMDSTCRMVSYDGNCVDCVISAGGKSYLLYAIERMFLPAR